MSLENNNLHGEILIRDARPEDAVAIAKLNREEMGYEYAEEKTREKLQALLSGGKDLILVAECGGAVVGYVHLCHYDLLYFDSMKNVMGIAVSHEFRRRGIGKKLLTAAEDRARADGAAAVRLSSGESRTEAHAFYRSLGYSGTKKQLNLKKEF